MGLRVPMIARMVRMLQRTSQASAPPAALDARHGRFRPSAKGREGLTAKPASELLRFSVLSLRDRLAVARADPRLRQAPQEIRSIKARTQGSAPPFTADDRRPLDGEGGRSTSYEDRRSRSVSGQRASTLPRIAREQVVESPVISSLTASSLKRHRRRRSPRAPPPIWLRLSSFVDAAEADSECSRTAFSRADLASAMLFCRDRVCADRERPVGRWVRSIEHWCLFRC